MTKCVLCGKDRAENEMRPLINIDELAVGNMLSEADEQDGVEAEREVGGATLQVVCRSCWHAILESKEKGDVIEMLETLCGLLFEVERRRTEEREKQIRSAPGGWGSTAPTGGGAIPLTHPPYDPSVIEKQRPGQWHPNDTSGPHWDAQKWAIGQSGGAQHVSLTSGTVATLGNQWDQSFGTTTGNNK